VLASFFYDNLGRRGRSSDGVGIARGNGATTAYAYDTADRLINLTQTLTDGSGNNWTRSYSPANQVLTHVLTNPNWAWSQIGSNDNRTSDGLNRDASVVAAGGYDANGNETIDKNGVRSFFYDVENRLVSESGGPAALTLAYDPLGRLSQTTASGTTTTTFLYDGSRLVAEYSGGALLRRYVHGPGTDEPLVWLEGTDFTQPHYLHADPQGSILAWSNASGAMGAINAYDPYGVPQTWSGSRFAYTGQIMLPEAQLYHYKARAYDPAFGRFLQTDPIGSKSDPDLYAYVQDDPTDQTDPTGDQAVGIPAGPYPIFIPPVAIPGTPENIQFARDAQRLTEQIIRALVGIIHHSDHGPPVPDKPVGENPRPGRSGGRIVSGPLTPENGGTGDADRDFDHLTGGTGKPNSDQGRPPGTQVGDNGVQLRPGPKGPRIDIPGKGTKPPETLHYPPPPPPPPPPPKP